MKETTKTTITMEASRNETTISATRAELKLSQEENTTILNKALSIAKKPKEIIFLEEETNFSICLSEKNLGSVFKNENKKIAFGVIDILVTRFVNSFGFSSQIPEERISVLVSDTFENFKYETLSDVVLFFKMARQGKFGTTHKGIDSNLIFGEWFPKYLELKSIEREKQVESHQKSFRKETLTLDDVKNAYAKMNPETIHDKIVKYVDEITKNITREMLENLIYEWNADEQKRKYIDILKRKRQSIK